MLATTEASVLSGLDAAAVRVEVDIGKGLPGFEIVGLPETNVKESRVRVRTALANSGFELPNRKITVNLAPADLRKGGASFDLAVAVGLLAASGAVAPSRIATTLLLGELSLLGDLMRVRGVLPQLLAAARRGTPSAVVPVGNASEASLARGIDVRIARTLLEVREFLDGTIDLPRPEVDLRDSAGANDDATGDDLADVRGQEGARRALEIAAAGGHGLLLVGPPGAGKTMLARRMRTVLPPMSPDEALEVQAIASVASIAIARRASRPFRAPHHTASEVALVGGGEPVRPGEITLAHRGVLFLDELPEFRRGALEALRQPLEDGVVSIVRARSRMTFPARPVLVAAMNPCPCGYVGDPRRACRCSPERVRAYRARLSGPLLDRIDMHVAVGAVPVGALASRERGEPSAHVRARVIAAREQAMRRGKGAMNATLTGEDLVRFCAPDRAGFALLARAVDQLGLSARAYARVLRVARTVADLDGVDAVVARHVAEAIGYRLLDRAPE